MRPPSQRDRLAKELAEEKRKEAELEQGVSIHTRFGLQLCWDRGAKEERRQRKEG